MGAILNIIRPANESYSSAEAIVETNQTGSAMIDYLDENLKYATNMLVLKDYVGVPKVNNGMLGGSSTIYKSCIIIDNNNLRGYSEKDYSGDDNDTAQKRMGCTGCIIRIDNINTDGLSFDNSQVALGVDEYGKFKFDISAQINGSAEDKKWNLDVSLDTYEPVYDGGTYSFTKTRYKAESSIDLVNINVKPEDPFRVNDFVDFSVAPDYTKYPQENLADATGYSTEQQKVYYDTANSDNKYTYIFFDKKTSADSVKYSVTFQYAADSPVNPGSIIASTMVVPGNKISGIPTLTAQAGYLAPVWKCDDGNVYTADEIKNYVVNNDVTFFAYYQPDSNYNPHTVTLYEMDGTTVFKTLSVQDGTIMPYPGPPSNVPENYKFLDWVLKSDNSKSYKDVSITAEGFEFVPLCEELLEVKYFDTENALFAVQYVEYDDYGSGDAITSTFNIIDTIPAVPSDQLFKGWDLDSDPADNSLYHSGDVCVAHIKPVTFKAVTEPKPPADKVTIHFINGFNEQNNAWGQIVVRSGGNSHPDPVKYIYNGAEYTLANDEHNNEQTQIVSKEIPDGTTFEIEFTSDYYKVEFRGNTITPDSPNEYWYYFKNNNYVFTSTPPAPTNITASLSSVNKGGDASGQILINIKNTGDLSSNDDYIVALTTPIKFKEGYGCWGIDNLKSGNYPNMRTVYCRIPASQLTGGRDATITFQLTFESEIITDSSSYIVDISRATD